MRDLNFFEPYVAKQRGTEKKQLVLYGILLLLLIGVLSYPVYNYIIIGNMEKEIADMKVILESPEAVDRFERVEEKEARIDLMTNQLKLIENIDQGIQHVDMINDILLYEILGTVPQDLFFEAMNVSSDKIMIQGNAKDKRAIAELEYNLRLTQVFDEIFVPSITMKDGSYTFAIQFKVKDVN